MASGRYELMMREALKSGDTARIIKVAKDIASKRKDPLKKKSNLDFFTKLGEDVRKNPKLYEASIKKFRTIDKPSGVKNTNVTSEELKAANRINQEEANAIAKRKAALGKAALESPAGVELKALQTEFTSNPAWTMKDLSAFLVRLNKLEDKFSDPVLQAPYEVLKDEVFAKTLAPVVDENALALQEYATNAAKAAKEKEETEAIAAAAAALATLKQEETERELTNSMEEEVQAPGLNVKNLTSKLQVIANAQAKEQGFESKEHETAEEELLKRIKEEIQTAPNPNWASMNARLVKLARGVRDTPLEEEYDNLKQVVLEKLIDAKKPGRTVFRTPEERDTLIATRTAGFKTSVEREQAIAALKALETRINTYEGPWSELLEPVIQQGPDFRGTELETRYNELKEYVVDKVLAEKETATQQKKTTAAEEEVLRERLLSINRIRKAEERLQESPTPTDESEMFGHAEAPVATNANMNALFTSLKEQSYIAKFKELANARRNPTPTRRIGDVARGLSPANLVGKNLPVMTAAVGAATKQPNVSVEGEGAKRLIVPGEADTAEETPVLNTGFQELLGQQESLGSFKQSEEEPEFTTLKPDEEDEELRAKAEEAFFTRKQAEDQSTTLAEAVNMFVPNEADKAKVGLRLPAVFAVKSFKVPEATVLAKFKEAAVPTKMALVKKLIKTGNFFPNLYANLLLETLDLEELNDQLKAEAAAAKATERARVLAEQKTERAKVLAERKAARATKKGGSRQYRRYTHKQR
jgi:hypothetical protein